MWGNACKSDRLDHRTETNYCIAPVLVKPRQPTIELSQRTEETNFTSFSGFFYRISATEKSRKKAWEFSRANTYMQILQNPYFWLLIDVSYSRYMLRCDSDKQTMVVEVANNPWLVYVAPRPYMICF